MVQAQQLSREDRNRLLRYATKWVRAFTGTAGAATPDLRENIARLYAVEGLPPPAEIRWCRDPFELKGAMKQLASAVAPTAAPQARASGGWKAMFRAYPELPDGLEQAVKEIGRAVRDAVAGPWNDIEWALNVNLFMTAGPGRMLLRHRRCAWLLQWDLAVHEWGIARPGAVDAVRIMEATPCAALFPEAALLLERPAVLALNEEGLLHAEDGPAVRWGPAENPTVAVYALSGNVVPPKAIEGGLSPEEFHKQVWCGDYLLRRFGLLWLARSRGAQALASWSGGTQRWALVQVPVRSQSSYHPITGLILEDRATGAIWSTRFCFDNVRKETKLAVPCTAAVWKER